MPVELMGHGRWQAEGGELGQAGQEILGGVIQDDGGLPEGSKGQHLQSRGCVRGDLPQRLWPNPFRDIGPNIPVATKV